MILYVDMVMVYTNVVFINVIYNFLVANLII
jgi:hypothetical protein